MHDGHRGALGPAIVYAIPFIAGLPAYALAVALGLVHWDPPSLGPWVAAVVAATILNVVLVPGEEFGWRGFMVPRLIEAEVPSPLVVSGVIWGVWHLPLILWGSLVLDGPAPWISSAIFMALAIALGYVLAWLRVETGRTRGPILLHVTWNVAFQAGFEAAVAGDVEGLWLGEAGLLTTAALVLAVGWLARPGGRLALAPT
jgi:membrane protease YdiL (CAAX protease family)